MLKQRNEQAIKRIAVFFAILIYAIGVIYGDIMFLQIIQRAFPTGMLGGLAMIGAIATGLTALTLPLALHWWFAPGTHHTVGWIFYAVDLALLVLNAILAYQISAGRVDGLLSIWWQFCPATPLICVAFWGLCFALDPSNKMRHTQMALQSHHIETVAKGMENAALTPEAQAYLNQLGINAMWQAAHEMSGQAVPQQLPQYQQRQQLPPPQTNVQPREAVTGQFQVLPQTSPLHYPPVQTQASHEGNQNGKQ